MNSWHAPSSHPRCSLICPSKDFNDPNARPRLWWIGYFDPQLVQQPSSRGSASSGGTAFYDAREEVIRFVLGRRTLEALQGWTLSDELGNTSMSRALTIDELTALSESGLVQSSSEDESMSYHDSSSDEDNIIALPLPSPSYSPTPSSDSEEAPQHEQREGDVEIEIEIEAVGTLACPSCIISQPGLTVQPRDGCYCGGGYCLRCGVDSCTCPWSSTVLSAHPLPHEEVRYPIAYILYALSYLPLILFQCMYM